MLFIVGGNWNNGTQGGLLTLNGNNDFGNAWTNNGFRLTVQNVPNEDDVYGI